MAVQPLPIPLLSVPGGHDETSSLLRGCCRWGLRRSVDNSPLPPNVSQGRKRDRTQLSGYWRSGLRAVTAAGPRTGRSPVPAASSLSPQAIPRLPHQPRRPRVLLEWDGTMWAAVGVAENADAAREFLGHAPPPDLEADEPATPPGLSDADPVPPPDLTTRTTPAAVHGTSPGTWSGHWPPNRAPSRSQPCGTPPPRRPPSAFPTQTKTKACPRPGRPDTPA
ncbi:DUF6087 family protein [Streptomyces violascens]|uniref:DUF6087 family protein n=1 Tax=Streptomyces violascens TaxID=67381 RepID=UPI0036978069